MKRDFNKWLQSSGPAAPVKTLTELRVWNITHTKAGAIKYGQSQLDISDEMDVEADRARYEVRPRQGHPLAGTHGIDEVMKARNLDALLFPGASGAAIAAKPGYPTVIVPFGMVPNAPGPSVPRGLRRQARALRRHLHGDGLHRAAAARARLRLRAGDAPPRAAALGALTLARTWTPVVYCAPSRAAPAAPGDGGRRMRVQIGRRTASGLALSLG